MLQQDGSSNIIQAAVALQFILDIDNYLYKLWIPQYMKEIISSVKFGKNAERNQDDWIKTPFENEPTIWLVPPTKLTKNANSGSKIGACIGACIASCILLPLTIPLRLFGVIIVACVRCMMSRFGSSPENAALRHRILGTTYFAAFHLERLCVLTLLSSSIVGGLRGSYCPR